MDDPSVTGLAAEVSPADAAFEGFTLARREPKAVGLWAALILAVTVFNGVVTVVLGGPAMAQLQALQSLRTTPGAAAPNPAALLSMMGSLIPTYLLIMVVALVFYAVMNAAVLRAVFRPEERRWGYLRFGAAELRQLAVLVLIGLIAFAVYLAMVVAVVIAAVLAGVAGAGASAASGGAGAHVALFGLIVLIELMLFLGIAVAMVFVMVRLSLASALTFATGRVRVFGSWPLTRRRFWPMFGAYVLAGVVMTVLFILLMAVFGAVGLALGGGSRAGFMFHPDMTSLPGYFSGLQVAYLVVSAPLSALWMATQAGVPARLYAQLTHGQRVADVFGEPQDASTRFGSPVPPERGF